jgi:hypothetical protein
MDILTALEKGTGHLQYALHIYGMPYCLCSHSQLAEQINASTTLKRNIFGNNLNGESTYHAASCFAIPNAITIPSAQSVTLNDTAAIPEDSGWAVDVHDRDYGIDWTAAPFVFPANLKGIQGIQNIPEIDNKLVLAKQLSSQLRKDSISLDIIDPSFEFDTRINSLGGSYAWIGSECVYLTGATDYGYGNWTLSIQGGTSGHEGRGLFRSVNQSHWGGLGQSTGECITAAPLGSIGGRGCALWAAYYDDAGVRQVGLWKLRHGRVKSTTRASDGIINLRVSGWVDWLKNEHQVSRADLRLAKYVFTRAVGEGSRAHDHAWQAAYSDLGLDNTFNNGSTRSPHVGICVTGNVEPPRLFSVWLCGEGETVVFDTADDVFAALADEFAKCWDGDTTQLSGDGTTNSPYIKLSDYTVSQTLYSTLWRPVVVGQTIDVVKVAVTSYNNYEFFGVIPWVFGTGCISENSKTYYEYYMQHFGPKSCDVKWNSPGINKPDTLDHFVYPYSALTAQSSGVDSYAEFDTGDLEYMPWTCQYYYDLSYTTEWRPTMYWTDRIEVKMQSLAIPKQTIGGNPAYRLYTQQDSDPRMFADGDQVHFTCQDRVDGKPSPWTILGTVDDADVGADGYGTIDLKAYDWDSWKSGAELDETIPAIRFPIYDSNPKHRPFNQWSSIFYCPGSYQDEIYGGDPFIARTQAGGSFKKLSSPIRAILGAYPTATSPVGAFSSLDFIPDISGDTDQPASIDWASLDDAAQPIIPGHVYRLDMDERIDLSKVLEAELLLHGVTATWELDYTTKQHIMRFKRLTKVNATDAINSGLSITTAHLAAGKTPQVEVNGIFRYNRMNVSANLECGEYKLSMPIESSGAKSRMGRTAAIDCECQLSWFKTMADASIGKTDLVKLESHLAAVMDFISYDFPVVSVSLTGKIAGRIHVGCDLLITDARVRNPYLGTLGLTNHGCRCVDVKWDLKNMSVGATLQLTGNPSYGWAPAAYSPSGSSYFTTPEGGDVLVFRVPDTGRNWFTTDGSRPDLSYFADWAYDKLRNVYTAVTDTDYKIKVIKRWASQQATNSATVDASTMVLEDGTESDCDTVQIIGLDHSDYATTLSGGKYYVDDALVIVFDTYDVVETPQKIYATWSDSSDNVQDTSAEIDGTRWK